MSNNYFLATIIFHPGIVMVVTGFSGFRPAFFCQDSISSADQLPEALITEHLASGALVEVMPRYPLPELGIYVIRPPGQHPARKIRVLTEMLIECFGESALNTQETR